MRFTLVALLVTLTSLPALAAKLTILDVPAYGGGIATILSNFKVNKSLNRAWVETVVDTGHDADSDMGESNYEYHVPGLRFEPALNAIVIDIDGQVIECAKWKNGGIFGISGWKSTGCNFSSKLVKKNVDDGFRITKVNYAQVYLNVAQ